MTYPHCAAFGVIINGFSLVLTYASFCLTRFEFENQKTRLGVQLEYICSLVEKAVKKNNTLKESIVKDEAGIVELKQVSSGFTKE